MKSISSAIIVLASVFLFSSGYERDDYYSGMICGTAIALCVVGFVTWIKAWVSGQ